MFFSRTRNFSLLVVTRDNGEYSLIQRGKTLETALKAFLDKMTLEELVSIRNIYAIEYGTFRSCFSELEKMITSRSRKRLSEVIGPAVLSKMPPNVKIKVY